MYKPKYINKLEDIPQLSPIEVERLNKVTQKFDFRTNEYYLSLIDWNDPDDPIRRIIIPNTDEFDTWGKLDASCESEYTVVPGCEHKYRGTALLLVNNDCGGCCRFCFRKRLFMDGNDEAGVDVSEGIEYIRKNPQISNVLLTGGDPFLLSTKKLENIIKKLREIDHVKIIRIGTKIPAFNPYRVLNDESLLEILSKYSYMNKKIYIMSHFNHPKELTGAAIECMDMLQKAGLVAINQTPLIRGVNDDPQVLRELFDKLSFIGVPPYYVFICRPTLGNKTYAIPVEKAIEIFDKARMLCSGLAKRARITMSHADGKVEVVGMTDENIIFRFHRKANYENYGRLLIFKRNPNAYWFDDYDESVEEFALSDVEEMLNTEENRDQATIFDSHFRE